jgi:hypothetical protein
MERYDTVVVGPDTGTTLEWVTWLRARGERVARCPGPYVIMCPRVDGYRCPLREAADYAIVEWQPDDDEHLGHHERYCTRLPDDGRTIFDRTFRAPRIPAQLEPA